MRYFIFFGYDGTNYHGWQIQPNANSVQQELQKALSTLLRRDMEVVGAGRTDTGVHARKMAAHFFSTGNAAEFLCGAIIGEHYCDGRAKKRNRILPYEFFW